MSFFGNIYFLVSYFPSSQKKTPSGFQKFLAEWPSPFILLDDNFYCSYWYSSYTHFMPHSMVRFAFGCETQVEVLKVRHSHARVGPHRGIFMNVRPLRRYKGSWFHLALLFEATCSECESESPWLLTLPPSLEWVSECFCFLFNLYVEARTRALGRPSGGWEGTRKPQGP